MSGVWVKVHPSMVEPTPPARDGLTPETAAYSALDLMAHGQFNSGLYWIKPEGYPFDAIKIYCDLENDEGGWMQAFAYHKQSQPVSEPVLYSATPQASADAIGADISEVATPQDPRNNFLLPELFWQMAARGEIREEHSISGGTWPNNTNRVVIFIGGRTAAGLHGNLLTPELMATARSVFGYNQKGQTEYGFAGNVCRRGYQSNQLGSATRYDPAGKSASTLGITSDCSHLTDGTGTSGTQTQSASASSWTGRGSGHLEQRGSSQNGSNPNGTRWATTFIR
jgi:hypothetical protein